MKFLVDCARYLSDLIGGDVRIMASREVVESSLGISRPTDAEAIAMAKQSVNNAELPLQEGLLEEAYLFQQSLRTSGAQQSMKKFMELGGQTRQGENRVGELVMAVAEALAKE